MSVKAVIWALALGTAACVVAGLWTMPAHAQEGPKCGPAADIAKQLKDQFNETPAGLGLVNPQLGIMLFLSPDGESWTILSFSPNGSACLIAGGKDWISNAPADPKKPGRDA